MGLAAILAVDPFGERLRPGADAGFDEPASVWGTVAAVGVVLAIAAVAFMKGRVLLGVIGLFVPVVALAGAVRLARPSSPWARWRYEDARRLRAEQRFAATRPAQRLRRRIGDVIAGKPSEGSG